MPFKKKEWKNNIYMQEFIYKQAVESRWVEKSTGDVKMFMHKSQKKHLAGFYPGSEDRLRLT